MNADLDNDIYRDDYEFDYDQLLEFSQKDKLPLPKQEDLKDYPTEIDILLAPSIKIVQEGIFSVWRRYVRLHRLQLYNHCQENDISRQIQLKLKYTGYEPERKQREILLQKCYIGYCSLEQFSKISFKLIKNKEFHDFTQVMRAYNKQYNAINYMKLIRNTYMREPSLLELNHFKGHKTIVFTEESAVAMIQTQYRRYKFHVTEVQRQIKILSNMTAEDLLEILKVKISQSSDKSLKEVFEMFDVNHDGHIVFEEFVQAFRDSSIMVPLEVLRAVFNQFDINKNDSIQYMEFLSKIQIQSVSNDSLLSMQLKVENSLQQLRTVMQREFHNFEELFNSLKCQDRLKIKQMEFMDFVTHYTLRFSKIQLDQLFHYLDSKNKGYLNIEDFSMIFLNKAPQALREEVKENKTQEENALNKMKGEIEDAKYLYHYIQAENMQNFIQERDNQLLDLLKKDTTTSTATTKKKVNFSPEIDQRVSIYKNQLLKLEIMIQQISIKTLQKVKESGLSLKQFFSQFTQRFPEKFIEPKEFLLMLNVIFNQVMDVSLTKALFKVLSNYYVERVSFEKYAELIRIGQEISPIQLRMKSKYGTYVQKLRPILLEEFQKCALLSLDLQTVTLRQTFEILSKYSLSLEMFEVQKLVDINIIQLKDRRYIVDYARLLDLLFPEIYLVEQMILKKFGFIILQIWNRHKQQYFDKKSKTKKKPIRKQPKPLGTKKTLKERMNDTLPAQQQQNEYSKQKSGDNYNFAKTIILECVEGAAYYAESQMFTLQGQQNFQRRPTIKDVIIFNQFQSVELPNLLGSISFDYLTQRIYLPDHQGILYTQDITANRLLQNINIGTRIPFNKSFIVDCLVVDQRMFILKSNWQFQLWNMAQKNDRAEMSIDLREGMGNATVSAKHLYENEDLILVLSSQRTHAHLISCQSLHIVKTVNLGCCVSYHFKSMNEAVERAVRKIVYETNQQFPIKLEMNLQEMEQQERLRRQALNFIQLFKDNRVQKGKLLHFLNRIPEDRDLLRGYLDEIADEEGYLGQQQFEEIFKEHGNKLFNIWDALNIIKVAKPNLKQLFSTYDESHKNQLNQKQLEQLLKVFKMKEEDVNNFVQSFPNGLSYQEMQQLIESPLSYDELLYRCQVNKIDLNELFKQQDIYNVGLLDRNSFNGILEQLPFGLQQSDIEYLAQQQVYDSESGRIKYREKHQENKQRIHDIQYMNDLGIFLYSVDYPKRGTIFATNDKLLATMEAHQLAPLIYYCKQSGCLISASQQDIYIWNIYKDLTINYDVNPPWKLKPTIHQKCNSQISSIFYLPINQLILIGCVDGISIYDPVSIQQETHKVKVRIKPGYYQEIDESVQNQRIPLIHSIEMGRPISFKNGYIQTPFQGDEGSQLLTLEYLMVMTDTPMGQNSKSVMSTVKLYLIHRQPIEIPSTQIDVAVPQQIQQQIEKEITTILESALRSKRARGVIGIEKELNKETLKYHTKRNLIKLSKQLIFQKDVEQSQIEIINEIIHSCKFNGGLNLSFVYNLLRSSQCLNPHNISFEEFKHIVLYSHEYQPPVKMQNQIELKLQNLLREGQIDLPLEFEQLKAIKLTNDRILMKPQFKKLLIKYKAYSNERDLQEFLLNDCVSLRNLMDRFQNDKLIYKLRMIARPDQIIKEIQKVGVPRQLLGRLSMQDKNGDGLLNKQQFMEAILENKALYSEFFDLYSETINGQQILPMNQVSNKILSIKENLSQKYFLQLLGKIKNTLIYRNLGMAYIFKEDEIPYHDFCDAIMDLKLPNVTLKEVHSLADNLAVDTNKNIPFVSFQHYINKLHVSDQFILITDFEQLVKVGNEILKNRDMLNAKFMDKKCPPWELRGFLNFLDFEQVDQYLIKVLQMEELSYDELIDRTVNFINKIKLDVKEDEKKSEGLKSILIKEQGEQKYKTITSVGDIVKECEQKQKLYEQCMQFDEDKNSFIELPIFSNILSYNLNVSQELLVNFQFEWTQLTKEKNINYMRFFKEYANYEIQQLTELEESNVNLMFKQLAQKVQDSGLNLGFALKRFYNYDNQDYMTIPQFQSFLEQIKLKYPAKDLQELLNFLGTEIPHAKLLNCVQYAQADVQIQYDPKIWTIASQQVSLSTLNKLGQWRQSNGLMKSGEFKRLFNQYDMNESLQLLKFAIVGNRVTELEANTLSKQIRLNQADLSSYYVNTELFSQAIGITVKQKLREKSSRSSSNLIIENKKIVQEVSDDDLSMLIKKIQKSMNAINCSVNEIALTQGIIITAGGTFQRSELKKLLDSLPFQWTMKDKHLIYSKFKEPINYVGFIKQFDGNLVMDPHLLMRKLFMGCYRKQMTLVQLFQQIGKNEASDSEVEMMLQDFMSPFEARYVVQEIICSNSVKERTFLQAIKNQKFNYLDLLLRNGIQNVNDSILEVMQELDEQSEALLSQIQFDLSRMGINLSHQIMFSLMNNYLHETKNADPMFEGRVLKIQPKQFFQYLRQKQKTYQSKIKEFYNRLLEQNLSVFEFFAVCDCHQDYSITQQELMYGFIQLGFPQFEIWDELEKVDLRVPFSNFLMRFMQMGCLQIEETEMTVEVFASAIKKLGNLNEAFVKLSEDDQISYKSLRIGQQKYKLDLSIENIQQVYLMFKKQYKEIRYKEFAQVMQGNRQIEIVHHAFVNISHIKGREYPDHLTLDQLKQFLIKKGIASQDITIIINSFEKTTLTNKEIEQKVIDFSNLKTLKDQLSSEKIVQFCHQLIENLRGQPNNFSKIYTQHGLGSINQIKYTDFFNFITYLEVPSSVEIIKTIYKQIDTEGKQIVKSIEIESYLRRSQSQARVKTLDHTKKAEVNDILHKGIKNILNSFRAKKISVSHTLDIISLSEFLSQFVVLNEPQLQLLFESIQDNAQIQKPTWGDFAIYLLDDPQKVAYVFFKECLEIFQNMLKRLNIRPSQAVRYFGGQKIYLKDFMNMMLSLGFNQVKLKLNYKNVALIFKNHGGDEMSDLEFLMLMTEQEPMQIGENILELLLNIYKFCIKYNILKPQLISILNLNKSGWLSREELVTAIRSLNPDASLNSIRELAQHLGGNDPLINVGQLCKLIYIGGSLNDNTIEVNAFFTKHYENTLLYEIIQLEQLGTGFDGLVQQITISVQDFFRLVPKHKEQDIALIIKSFGLRQDQLDLERIYETIVSISKDMEMQESVVNPEQSGPLEQSVVLKFMEQPIKRNTSFEIISSEIIQHICAILNQNQMSLMKSVFQDKGYLTVQEFQILLANIGVPLSLDQTRTLIKLIDSKSFGDMLHYTELLSQIEAQGYQIIKDDVNNVQVQNQLLQRFCQLDFGDANYSDQMTVSEFYRLISLEGERHPFNDAEFQRLANMFAQNGYIQKSLMLRILSTKKQNFVDDNLITKEQLKNIFYRFNGFELILNRIRQIRELFNSNVEYFKGLEDSGLTSLSLQIRVTKLSAKNTLISQYLQNDVKLIQTAVFTLLNNSFIAKHISPHITIKSERSKMSQLQLSLSGVFLKDIPETQFVPTLIPKIEGRQCYQVLGKIAATNQPVRVTVWTVPILQTVCYDGIILKAHIMEELRFQQVFKGACQQLGVLEKKNNMGTEIHQFVLDQGRCLRDVCQDMGGLLKIPQLVLSGQMIYVAKLWLRDILDIYCEIQNYGYSMPLMRTDILYLYKDEIKISDLNGIQAINLNRFAQGIDVKLLVETVHQTTLNQLAMPPEFYSKSIQEITQAADTWQFGILIYEILFGGRPVIISQSGTFEDDKLQQLVEPSDYESGDLLQKEVFTNLRQQLSDIICINEVSVSQQIEIQLGSQSLGSYIQYLFKSQNTDEEMLKQIGQLIDLMCVCLQYEPNSRPTLQAIQKSGLLSVDTLNAKQIARPIINYKNPRILFHQIIYLPSRQLALDLMVNKPIENQSIHNIIGFFVETIQTSIVEEQKLDLITYLFHSRVLDILNFIVLHLNYRNESPELIQGFAQVFIELQKHLAVQDNPASQHVEAIVTTLVKFTLGEPYRLISDRMFMVAEEGFFKLGGDSTDKAWKDEVQYFSLWTPLIYKIVAPIYKEMISESGVGSGSMVAIRNYIQLCTEKHISPFDMNKFSMNQTPVKYNTIARTAQYYSEVMAISDAQLQIANYLNGSFSKSSMKISLNYLSAIIKSNKFSKLQVLVDSRIGNLLIQLLQDKEFTVIVAPMFAHISQAFQNEVPSNLRIEHSQSGMVQQYQQNNAVHLLRNLSIICHILQNSKNTLSNERFLSFQPTEQNQQDQSKTQKLNLYLAEQAFSLPSIYQGMFVAMQHQPQYIYKIMSNVLQWPQVGRYALGGVTQQLLVEMFKPMALQAEHKKAPLLIESQQLYEDIVNMALPNTIELIHQSKVRIMLQTHNLKVPEKSTSERFVQVAKQLLIQWQQMKDDLLANIREQLHGRVKRKQTAIPFFDVIKLTLKQISAFVVYTSKEVLLEQRDKREFIRQTFKLIQVLFKDLLVFGQLHEECSLLLQSLSDFVMNLTLISPLLVFDLEDPQFTKESIEWVKDTVDYIYEFHIEWDRVNEERQRKIDELQREKEEEQEKNQQYLQSLKFNQSQSSKLGKNVSFKIDQAQSRITDQQQSRIIIDQSQSKIIDQSKIMEQSNTKQQQQQQQQQQSSIINVKSSHISHKKQKLQESQISLTNSRKLEFAIKLELRPYSQNKLIQCALNFLKCFTAIIDSNINQYLQILVFLNIGTWFTNLTYKMWIIFERVVGPSFEETLIIKNQVDESMVRTTLFEAISKCQSHTLQEQLINAGFIKGIFAYLLTNHKSFEIQKILNSHSYVPFIHWMPYRHEALIYFTAIIWERKNCVNFYNEMMIETHARNTLQEESFHLSSKIDNKTKQLNSTVMFTRVYILCLLISSNDSGLLFLMKQLKINQKLLQLFQANEDFRQLFQGIYQYLSAEELEI